MRVYDLVTSEYSEYKYALTFDELLNREVYISKNIYTTTGCISEGNSTKAKADYIAINPLYMLKEKDANVKVILKPNELQLEPRAYASNNIELQPDDLVAVYYNFDDYYKLNYCKFGTGNIYDGLKRFTYFTDDKAIYDKLVADQNVSKLQCTTGLNNEMCKQISRLCNNKETFGIGAELLANCYMCNLPLTCVIIGLNYNRYNESRKYLSKRASILLKTMLLIDGYSREYFKEICNAFNQYSSEQRRILNMLEYENNPFIDNTKLTINEILDEWD